MPLWLLRLSELPLWLLRLSAPPLWRLVAFRQLRLAFLYRPDLRDSFLQPYESLLDFAGFRVGIANYPHRFARSFTCPSICRSALTAHGQPFAVTDTAIRIDRL